MIRFQILSALLFAAPVTEAPAPKGAVTMHGKASESKVLVCLRTGEMQLTCYDYNEFHELLEQRRKNAQRFGTNEI